jgi:hypothetical protein
MSITNKLIIMTAIIVTLTVINAAWSISMRSQPRVEIGGGGALPTRGTALW